MRRPVPGLIQTREAVGKPPPGSLTQDEGSNEKCLVTAPRKAADVAMALGEPQGVPLRLKLSVFQSCLRGLHADTPGHRSTSVGLPPSTVVLSAFTPKSVLVWTLN